MTGTPYELLVEADGADLPLTFEDRERIDELRAYAAAGWVEASMPEPIPAPGGVLAQPPATLRSLTSAGRKVAEQARGSKRRRAVSGRARLLRG